MAFMTQLVPFCGSLSKLNSLHTCSLNPHHPHFEVKLVQFVNVLQVEIVQFDLFQVDAVFKAFDASGDSQVNTILFLINPQDCVQSSLNV